MRPCGALWTNMDTISCATSVLHTEPVQELLALYLPASLPAPHTPASNTSRKGLLPVRKAEVLRLEEMHGLGCPRSRGTKVEHWTPCGQDNTGQGPQGSCSQHQAAPQLPPSPRIVRLRRGATEGLLTTPSPSLHRLKPRTASGWVGMPYHAL